MKTLEQWSISCHEVTPQMHSDLIDRIPKGDLSEKYLTASMAFMQGFDWDDTSYPNEWNTAYRKVSDEAVRALRPECVIIDDPVQPDEPSSALDVQEGGDHYRKLKIQPIEYIYANNLGFCEGNIVKYITRWRDKGGVQDLDKVQHYVELLKELHNVKEQTK